jgi:inorganic pyrophosphatase
MLKLNEADIRSFIGRTVLVKMDLPIGSSYDGHPEKIIYPINYGFIPHTLSGDGEELDAYVLGVFTAQDEFTGKCIAVIHRLNDDDDKLIVVPEGQDFSDEQIKNLTNFQEKFFISEIWR